MQIQKVIENVKSSPKDMAMRTCDAWEREQVDFGDAPEFKESIYV